MNPAPALLILQGIFGVTIRYQWNCKKKARIQAWPLFIEEISSASCFLLVRVSPLIINLE